MLPQYPSFAKIDLTLRDEIRSYTSRYDPYSDFNFTSIFCWDVENNSEISLLNDNLVIRLPDYVTGEPIVSLLGDTLIDETAILLLNDNESLCLVPDVVVSNILERKKFMITEDRDGFDYIYSLEEHAMLNGKKYKSKRNKISRFAKKYHDYELAVFDIRDDSDPARSHKEVFIQWAIERDRKHSEISAEGKAIDNFIENARHLDLIGVEIRIEGKVVGFSINEILNSEFAVCHFQKSILTYDYVDIVLTNYVAQILFERGCKYINWEQDLGLPGLRTLKESYMPVRYLKKYNIKLA